VGLKGEQVVIVAWDSMETFVRSAEWWSLTPADPERVVIVAIGEGCAKEKKKD
jgi:hypothetical protein